MNLQLNDPTVPAPGEMVGDNQGAPAAAPAAPAAAGTLSRLELLELNLLLADHLQEAVLDNSECPALAQ